LTRARERSVSRAENGAEWAEKRVERSGVWSGHGKKRWSGSGVLSRNRAGSGLNRPLIDCSNLTFHSTDFITYIVCIEQSAVYYISLHSFTLHALVLSLVQTQPNLLPITQLRVTRPNPSHRDDAF